MGNWKQVRVLLSQESSQQFLAEALGKQFHLIHYMFFFPPFLISISKGRTLSWSKESCREWGREKNPNPVPEQKSLMTSNKTHFPGEERQLLINFLVAFVRYGGVGKGTGEQECPLEL